MAPIRFDLAGLAAVLPAGGRTMVAGASGESLLLAEAVMTAGEALGAMTFTGIFVPGLNRGTYLANPSCRVETFFVTPELKAAGAAVEFLPLCYSDIFDRLDTVRIDAALMMVTPPNAAGNCSFGPAVDFLADLWRRIPIRIAHINPMMPRTCGHPGIPFAEITAFTEAPQPCIGQPETGGDAVADAIAGHIAPYVSNGATLQTGLGKVPGAVLRALTGRRDLRLHSGLIGDAVVDLEAAGALAPGCAVTAGVAIGSARLYAAIGGPAYDFRPVSITHNARIISAISNFVAINSAMEVDLFGQAYAELGPNGLSSGPGGASDYARAVKIGGGLRIVALAATAARGAVSRIALPGTGAGPVSLGRMDIDIVVTEFGAAELRGRSHADRANALIAIAAPDHRDALRSGWSAYASQL
jgi:acyl-CoA hydrolase